DVAGLDPKGLRPRLVDVQAQGRRVERLVHVDVDRAGNGSHLPGQFFGREIVAPLIDSGDLDVDGCGGAEVEDLGDDVRWLEEELDPGEALGQLLAQVVNIAARGPAALRRQLHQHLRVRAADGPRVRVAQVYPAVG